MNTYWSLFLFLLLTLLAEIIGTIGGFGSSLFFVSSAQFIYDFQTVLALTGLLHIFSNTAKVIFFRKTINWKLVLEIGMASILLAILGAWLTNHVSFVYAKIVLGIFLIAFSLFFFWKPTFILPTSLTNSALGGGVSGFLAGFIGTGGAVRGLVLTSFNLEKNLFVGTSAAIDFGVDLSRTVIYIGNQYLIRDYWIYIPMLIIASFVGSYLGKVIINKISQESFRKVVLSLILLMGVALLIGQLL